MVWNKRGPKGLGKELYASVTTSTRSFYHKNKTIWYVVMPITVWCGHNVTALVALLTLCSLPVSMHRGEHSGEFTWPPYSPLSATHFLPAPSPPHRRDRSKPQPPRGWVPHYPLVLLPYESSCADPSPHPTSPHTHTHMHDAQGSMYGHVSEVLGRQEETSLSRCPVSTRTIEKRHFRSHFLISWNCHTCLRTRAIKNDW